MVMTAVLRDAATAARFEGANVFSTNAETGIHRVAGGIPTAELSEYVVQLPALGATGWTTGTDHSS